MGFSPPSIVQDTLIDTWEEPVKTADISAGSVSQSSTTISAVICSINIESYKLINVHSASVVILAVRTIL